MPQAALQRLDLPHQAQLQQIGIPAELGLSCGSRPQVQYLQWQCQSLAPQSWCSATFHQQERNCGRTFEWDVVQSHVCKEIINIDMDPIFNPILPSLFCLLSAGSILAAAVSPNVRPLFGSFYFTDLNAENLSRICCRVMHAKLQ